MDVGVHRRSLPCQQHTLQFRDHLQDTAARRCAPMTDTTTAHPDNTALTEPSPEDLIRWWALAVIASRLCSSCSTRRSRGRTRWPTSRSTDASPRVLTATPLPRRTAPARRSPGRRHRPQIGLRHRARGVRGVISRSGRRGQRDDPVRRPRRPRWIRSVARSFCALARHRHLRRAASLRYATVSERGASLITARCRARPSVPARTARPRRRRPAWRLRSRRGPRR